MRSNTFAKLTPKHSKTHNTRKCIYTMRYAAHGAFQTIMTCDALHVVCGDSKQYRSRNRHWDGANKTYNKKISEKHKARSTEQINKSRNNLKEWPTHTTLSVFGKQHFDSKMQADNQHAHRSDTLDRVEHCRAEHSTAEQSMRRTRQARIPHVTGAH